MRPDIRPILACYDATLQPTAVAYLGSAGGFSGSLFWRLSTPRGPLALRRYPPGASTAETLWLNALTLEQLQPQLEYRLPVPLRSRTQSPFVHLDGHAWDLGHWLPGTKLAEEAVRAEHVTAAMTALAQLHRALDQLPAVASAARVPQAVERRLRRIAELQQGQLTTIVEHVAQATSARSFWRDAASTLAQYFAQHAQPLAESLADSTLYGSTSWCLVDIWRDNLLYDATARVSAVLDCARFEPDSVATDIARLLGSFIAGHPNWWPMGLAAYTSIRPLERAELELAICLDRANVLLSAWNWLQWRFVDQRQFDDLPAIEARVRHFLARLCEVFAPPSTASSQWRFE